MAHLLRCDHLERLREVLDLQLVVGAGTAVQLEQGCAFARQMTSPEAYIQYSPDVFQDDGEVTNDSTREFLRAYMAEFRTYIGKVLTVLPRPQEPSDDATGEPSGKDDGR
jgi:hypothetical protein